MSNTKDTTRSKIKGLTSSEFDGVSNGTLRAWIRFWENENRSTDEELKRINTESNHPGFTRSDHVHVITAELDARKAPVGSGRTRISTTVDTGLLASARHSHEGLTDSSLIDEALAALLARRRATEYDAAYAAYDSHPLDEPDAWGDLASFHAAAEAS